MRIFSIDSASDSLPHHDYAKAYDLVIAVATGSTAAEDSADSLSRWH
ncbi:hypothetical protein FM103_01910 [Corynebacterium xerosis]|nr:hypothetical protein FM103_01910 [Corynebacterium xerosis]